MLKDNCKMAGNAKKSRKRSVKLPENKLKKLAAREKE